MTDKGQRHFLKVRDKAKELLKIAGAFQAEKVMMSGSTDLTLASLDRMIELGEIERLDRGSFMVIWSVKK